MNSVKKLALLCLFLLPSGLFAQEKLILCARTSDSAPFKAALDGFTEHLNNTNIRYKLIEYNYSEAPPAGLQKPDLIFSMGTNPTRIISDKYKDTPLVYTFVMNTEFTGKNITSVEMDVPLMKQLHILSRISRRSRIIGIMYDPARSKILVEKYAKEIEGTEYRIVLKQIHSVKEVYDGIRKMRDEIDCLLIIPDPTVYTANSTEDILLFSLREGLPVIGLSETYVKAGALFALSCSYKELGKRSGELAEKIFKGEAPAAIPRAYMEKYELSLNLIVAQRLDIKIPDELLKGADHVYK